MESLSGLLPTAPAGMPVVAAMTAAAMRATAPRPTVLVRARMESPSGLLRRPYRVGRGESGHRHRVGEWPGKFVADDAADCVRTAEYVSGDQQVKRAAGVGEQGDPRVAMAVRFNGAGDRGRE